MTGRFPRIGLAACSLAVLVGARLQAEEPEVVSADPGYVRLLRVQHVEAEPYPVVLKATDGAAFEVTKVRSPNPHLKAEIYPENDSGSQWLLAWKLDPAAPVGPLSGIIELETSHPRQPLLKIPLSGFMRPLIVATPPSLNFGEVELRESQRKRLSVRSFAPGAIQVLGAEVDVPGIRVELEPLQEGREYQVWVTLQTTMAKGAFSGKLSLRTSDARLPLLEVPLSGTVR